jgi:hypothetical protein
VFVLIDVKPTIWLLQNLLSTLPNSKLRKTAERLYRVNETLVPHLIAAMKNLQYAKNFYPMPDLVSYIRQFLKSIPS